MASQRWIWKLEKNWCWMFFRMQVTWLHCESLGITVNHLWIFIWTVSGFYIFIVWKGQVTTELQWLPSLRHLFIKGERAVSSLPSCSWNMQTMPMARELCNCFTEVAITNTTAFFPSPLLSPGGLYRVLWCNLTPGDLHVFLVWQWTAFSRARSLVRCVCCSSRACPKTFQGVVTRCPLWSSLLTVIPVRMPFLFMAQPCVSGLWRVLLLGVGIPRWPITTV